MESIIKQGDEDDGMEDTSSSSSSTCTMTTSHDQDMTCAYQDEILVGILGGVGPAAGVLLHSIILNHTQNNGHDQGHLSICHLSRSNDTSDRTDYLLSSHQETLCNPAQGMSRTLAMMNATLTTSSSPSYAVAGVPCNTFHAAPIWNEFKRLAKIQNNSIKLLHMLEETMLMIQDIDPKVTKIGLMSTTGTRQARVYQQLLEPMGYEILQVSDNVQCDLHDTIYNQVWGIKATAPAITPRAVNNFIEYATMLEKRGAEVIIMGCTEIPFAFVGQDRINEAILIDPMVALGRALIREASPTQLKPLEVTTHDVPFTEVLPKSKSFDAWKMTKALGPLSQRTRPRGATGGNKEAEQPLGWRLFDFYSGYVAMSTG